MRTYFPLLPLVLAFLLISCLMFCSLSIRADQNDPKLDQLFNPLLGTDDPAQGSLITEEIWQRWLQVDDPVIKDLLANGVAAMSANDLGLALDSFTQVIERAPELKGRIFGGFTEILRHKRVASASVSFGVIMGVIPGVGEFLAQFFSYTLAQRISNKPERFGRGVPEGLIASETANNAVPAAMVPLLALGIPGEALTAMMLSVFYVHGIIPGPKLFENSPEFLTTLYICLFVVNVLILGFLLVSTNTILKVIRIPTRFLGVCIFVLTFVGVYSLRNSIVDCAICAVFGLLGYILKRLKLPIVPIVLGMVLGNIMEQKFRASLARVETPLDFIVLALIGQGVSIVRARKTKALSQ